MSVSHWDAYEPASEIFDRFDDLDGLDTFDLLDDAPLDLDDAEWCMACGAPGPLSRQAGAPFCLDCLRQGTLAADWSLWEDLGGGG